MANSLLQSFVTGARAMLATQLIIAVGAVALAGWTLGVTNQLIRERDRLEERVIQLEETMAARGETPPPPTAVVEPVTQTGDAAYPGSMAGATAPTDVALATTNDAPAQDTADSSDVVVDREQRDLGAIVGSLFGPAPPLRTVVLHVRAREDLLRASQIARALQQAGDVRVLIDVMAPGDPRQSGYAYFDGRQSRAAADVVTRFHEAARELQIAQWSAQLRGVALPAQGEYAANRLDLVLPPLPAAPVVSPPAPQR